MCLIHLRNNLLIELNPGSNVTYWRVDLGRLLFQIVTLDLRDSGSGECLSNIVFFNDRGVLHVDLYSTIQTTLILCLLLFFSSLPFCSLFYPKKMLILCKVRMFFRRW